MNLDIMQNVRVLINALDVRKSGVLQASVMNLTWGKVIFYKI